MKNKNYFKASFMQTDITPDFEVELIGCMREDNISKGVLHRLYGQMLLMESEDEYFCLIAIDSLGLTTALADDLRNAIAKELGTDISRIMINFSHTHSAPAPLSQVNGEKYYRLMCDNMRKCAKNALSSLSPCKIAWALSETAIGENRRAGCDEVDRRLLGIKFENLETKLPVALVLRTTAHANVLMNENDKISSDYFGMAREKISNYFDCPVMILQGAAGNIKPVGVDTIFGGNLSDALRISDILSESAKSLNFTMENVEDIEMYEKDIVYKSDVPSKAEAEKISEDGRRIFGMDGSQWLLECQNLREADVKFQIQNRKIQFFRLNNLWICGVPDEIFCEISLEAANQTDFSSVFLNGYTNGCAGYLPHEEEWLKGGYETLYSYFYYYKFHGHVMPFQMDTAGKIVEAVSSEWKRK